MIALILLNKPHCKQHWLKSAMPTVWPWRTKTAKKGLLTPGARYCLIGAVISLSLLRGVKTASANA